MLCVRTLFKSTLSLITFPPRPSILLSYRPLFLFTSSPNKDANVLSILAEITRGKEALNSNKLNNGLSYYQEALNILGPPENVANLSQEETALKLDVHQGLAKIYSKKEQFAESLKHYQEAIDLAQKSNSITSQDLASLYNEIAHAHLGQSKLEEARSFLEKARDIINSGNKEKVFTPELLDNEYLSALVSEKEGKVEGTIDLLKELLSKAQGAPAGFKWRNFELFHIYLSLGSLCERNEETARALYYWKRGLEQVFGKYGGESFHSIPFYEKMIEHYFSEGKHQEVISHTEKNLSLCKLYYDEGQPEFAKNYLMLGLAFFEQGDHVNALENYQKALTIFLRYPKQYYEEITYSYLSIAQIHFLLGQQEQGTTAYEKGLDFTIKTLGKQHPRLAEYYLFWTDLLKQQGKGKEAKDVLEKALDIYLQSDSKDWETISELYADIGDVLYKEGEYEQALKYYEESLKSVEKANVKIKIKEKVNNAIGLVYFQQQKFEESEKYFQKALDLCSKSTDSKNLDIYYKNLGVCYESRNMDKEAMASFTKALDLAEKNFGKSGKITREYFEILVDRLARQEKFEEIEKLRMRFPG